MTNNVVSSILDDISKDYHEFLEKANLLAKNSLVNKNVEYRFYQKNLNENIDFDKPKTSTGKVTSVTVTSDNDILFDVIDNLTEQKHILFSCDILNVKGQ